jgi:flagellar biosynthesis/type III secretory pathway protein FliH
MDSKDIQNLMLGTIQELGKNPAQDITAPLVLSPSQYNKFMELHTPEAIAKYEAAQKAERDRLAAIEAAKSPAQRLKEKQEACSHEFPRVMATNRVKCRNCGFTVTRQFAKGYNMGHSDGYDAGRDSVECD